MKVLLSTCCSLILVFWTCSTELQAGSETTTLFQTGKMHFEAGEYEKAVEAFSRALQIVEPDTSNVHLVRLARAQAYYGKGDFRRAWADLNAVLRSDGLDGETLVSGLMLRATLNLDYGKDKKAFDDFAAAINTSHVNNSLRSLSFTNRGIALINRGEVDQALNDLNQAISIDPKSGFAHAARGLAYLRADKLESALRDGQRAMSLNPDPPTAKIAQRILKEFSVTGSSPFRVSVPLNEHGQIFVQVRFSKNGPPHRFLLDTGATHSVVNRRLLMEISRESKVQEIGKSKVVLADGSTHPVTRYRVRNTYLFDLPLGEIEVHVFDRKTKGVMNLLGTRSLSNVVVSIDNAKGKVEISRKDVPRNTTETN